jgi:5-methylcytosine-specific restriction endonuclease McrA
MMDSPVTGWTSARFKSFIISALRSGMRRFPNKAGALKAAFTKRKRNTRTNRLGKHYRCAGCGGEFPHREVQVDHIEPVVSAENGWTNWDDFVSRLYCSVDGLQVLCMKCHTLKTQAENKQRRVVK